MARPSGFRFPFPSLLNTPKRVAADSESVKRLFLDDAHASRRYVQLEQLEIVTSLPKLVDRNEWLATNVLGFFNQINQCCSILSDFCTSHHCPSMTAGQLHYQWSEDKGKKLKLSAWQHIDLAMSCVEGMIQDEQIFPTKFGCFSGLSENEITVDGSSFPQHFTSHVKKIFRLLFQVLAHFFHHHYQDIIDITLHAHLNTLVSHFLFFAEAHQLLDRKETAPLEDFMRLLSHELHPVEASAAAKS